MIVWVKKEATGYPNDQRFEILNIRDEETIYVISCGNGDPFKIKAADIVGIELTEELTIRFKVTAWSRTH